MPALLHCAIPICFAIGCHMSRSVRTKSANSCGVIGRVDIITGTLGKALGGASGGYTAGPKEVIAWLRNRSRPYLFSNTLMPAIAHASIAVLELLQQGDALREKLVRNAEHFRRAVGPVNAAVGGGQRAPDVCALALLERQERRGTRRRATGRRCAHRRP